MPHSVFLKLINKKLKAKNLLLQFVLGPVKGLLDLLDYLEPVGVVLWWHVPRSNRWTTWMTELLVQTMTKWSAGGVSVWCRSSRTQCSESRNRGLTKEDRMMELLVQTMTKWSAGESKSSVTQRPVSQSRRKSKVSQKSS